MKISSTFVQIITTLFIVAPSGCKPRQTSSKAKEAKSQSVSLQLMNQKSSGRQLWTGEGFVVAVDSQFGGQGKGFVYRTTPGSEQEIAEQILKNTRELPRDSVKLEKTLLCFGDVSNANDNIFDCVDVSSSDDNVFKNEGSNGTLVASVETSQRNGNDKFSRNSETSEAQGDSYEEYVFNGIELPVIFDNNATDLTFLTYWLTGEEKGQFHFFAKVEGEYVISMWDEAITDDNLRDPFKRNLRKSKDSDELSPIEAGLQNKALLYGVSFKVYPERANLPGAPATNAIGQHTVRGPSLKNAKAGPSIQTTIRIDRPGMYYILVTGNKPKGSEPFKFAPSVRLKTGSQ